MKSNESEQRVRCVCAGEPAMACEVNASSEHGDSDDGSWDASYQAMSHLVGTALQCCRDVQCTNAVHKG